jgi:hypothetical protein
MTTKDLAVTSGETSLTKWEDELARQAKAAATQEASTGGGNFFSLRGGQLKLNGAVLPDNQMAVIVLDALIENVFYSGPFDPEDPQTPDCYAFGRDDKTMVPHADVAKPQAEGCAACPNNQWGSLTVGGQQRRGKACRNRRRLGLIPAGTLQGVRFTAYTTAEEIITAPLAYLALPPTSLGGFATYVKQLAGALNRPPRAMFTKVALTPDVKSQFKVAFTALGPVPNELLGAVMERAKEVAAMIEFPYQAGTRTEAPAPGKGDNGKGKKPRKY